MSFEEEFDRIIRQKAEEADFPLDDKHWEAASKMLDQRNAASRKPVLMRWVLPSALVLLLGVSAYTWFIAPDADSETLVTAAPLHTTAQTAAPQVQSAMPATQVRESATSELKSAALLPAGGDLSQKTSPAAPALAASGKHVVEIAQTADADVKPIPMVTNQAPEANADMEGSQPLSPAATIDPSGAVVNEGGSAANAQDHAEADPARSIPVVSAGANNTENHNQESSAGSESNAAPVTDVAPDEHALQVSSLTMLLPQGPAPEINILPFTEMQHKPVDYVRNYRHFAGVEGGAAFARGWDVKGKGTDGKGLNYFGGVFYLYGFSKRHGIQAGFQYYNFAHITQPYYISTGKSYGFGYNSHVSEVTAEQLSYICLPLKYVYNLSNRYQAGLGVNFSQLVGGKSRVEQYNIADGVKGPVIQQAYNKPFEGTNNFGLAGSAFVRVKMTERIWISGELFYSFTDMFRDYGDIRRSENSTALRAGLYYVILKK